MKPMHYALALSATIAVAGFAFTSPQANAANSAMATCNKQWNDETAAKTTNGVTYQDFLRDCLHKNSASAAPAAATGTSTTLTEAATTTTVAAAATTTDATVKPATADTVVDPALAKAKKDCGGPQWKAAKLADTTNALKKKDFVTACLTKAGFPPTDTPKKPVDAMKKPADTMKKPADTAAATTTVAPADQPATVAVTKPATTAVVKPVVVATAPPMVTPADPTTDVSVKTTDKNGKPKSPKQIAEEKRITECGTEWKAAKVANTTNGLKWPQFWSQCNMRLKCDVEWKAAQAGGTTKGVLEPQFLSQCVAKLKAASTSAAATTVN